MKKTLQSLYENMGLPPIVEEDSINNTFSKFDLADYTELINEGKVGHGATQDVLNLMRDAESRGIIKVRDTKKGWMLFSTKYPTMRPETIDRGERSLHFLRRFLHKIEN